ncbi:hypothetical protein TSMEX_001271 [Taenia solium]|eukprot:TsM_000309600 transcript=TsM_000309600 gene=TsM_000309600
MGGVTPLSVAVGVCFALSLGSVRRWSGRLGRTGVKRPLREVAVVVFDWPTSSPE